MQASEARDAISRRLVQAGFTNTSTTLTDAEALVARQSQWTVAGRMHVFVVVSTVDRLSGEGAERLATAAQEYAIKHKGGLPRGLQTGTATIIVFLAEHPQDTAVRWVDRSPIHRFAALRFPVLVDVADHEVVYWEGRWVSGWVFRERILALVRTSVLEPLTGVFRDDGEKLRSRRAVGTEEEKMADAITDHQKKTLRMYAAMVPVALVPAVAILYSVGGLGPAVTGLLLGGAAVGWAAWMSLR